MSRATVTGTTPDDSGRAGTPVATEDAVVPRRDPAIPSTAPHEAHEAHEAHDRESRRHPGHIILTYDVSRTFATPGALSAYWRYVPLVIGRTDVVPARERSPQRYRPQVAGAWGTRTGGDQRMAAPMTMSCSRRHLILTFPPDAAMVAKARANLDAVMVLWGADELIDSATLLMSELVTNALQHTQTADITVQVAWTHPCLRVEVQDGDSASPSPTAGTADTSAVSGRGLFLEDTLSERWGTAATPTGKQVWFELRASARTPQTGDLANMSSFSLSSRSPGKALRSAT